MMRSILLLGLVSVVLGGRVHSRIHRVVTAHTHGAANATTEAKPAAAAPQVVAAVANKKALRAAAPAPAPAPITQADIIGEMKKKMAEKVGHYDADFVLDRPTTVPPGHDGQVAPGPKSNLVPNAPPAEKPAAGAPGAAPAPAAPAPAPVPDTGMSEAALNPLVKHNDNETMTDDWGAEYGPKGPRGLHGPYQPMAAVHSNAKQNGVSLFVATFVGLLVVRL